MHFRQSHQHPSIKVLNLVLDIHLDPSLILIEGYLIFGRWDWRCFLWGWQTSSMIMRTSGATRTIFWRRHDMTWLLFEEHSYGIPICPAALRYFALMSPSHRMPSMIIHASMEHLIPSRKVYRASGAHQMLWAGSLQDKRQLAECGFRGHGPSDLERLCRRKDSFRLGILCGRCVNICVEHVARIQFNISKLHSWARYIAIWYKLAMSFSPPTLCLLAGPVVKGRQRSGKDTASFSYCIQESQTGCQQQIIADP